MAEYQPKVFTQFGDSFDPSTNYLPAKSVYPKKIYGLKNGLNGTTRTTTHTRRKSDKLRKNIKFHVL
ncbi:hypothetical protein R3W88_000938 [Solanum pinnatisectum]|uniref:Uncharacterized protein n=1 Tax=Solanum pinnatisectum TaxID=50273 RepID=A0AAV9MH53_9SOLN|nr:hypothetical protein R3W88_000938 [Solanum pinnatisectum]